jgi:Tfp pilus assembly protein PilF
MEKKKGILGWTGTVLLVSLFLFFAGTCETKTDQAKKHFDLGVQYLEEQKLDEALRELRHAIQLDSNFADAHLRLGGLYHDLKAYSSAIKEYEEVLRINPNYPKIHTASANVYYERGLRAWVKAAKQDRLTYWFPDTLRQLPFKNRDELVGLIKEYLNKLEADTLDAETFSKLSQANFLLAAEEYQKAIQVDSLDTTAQLYLGLTYSEQGYPHKAMAQYEILKKLTPNAGELLLTVLRQKEKEKQELEKYKKK